MSIQRARSVEEYVDFVQQVLYEVEELRVADEYDMEDMGGSLKFVDDLEESLRELYQAMNAGSHRFEHEDPPFMEIVDKYGTDKVPFRYLLRQINETHRQGLDVADLS